MRYDAAEPALNRMPANLACLTTKGKKSANRISMDPLRKSPAELRAAGIGVRPQTAVLVGRPGERHGRLAVEDVGARRSGRVRVERGNKDRAGEQGAADVARRKPERRIAVSDDEILGGHRAGPLLMDNG